MMLVKFMKIGIIQNQISENILETIQKTRQQILQIDADMVILPEIWNCPYANDIMKESIHYFQQSYDMMKTTAKEKGMWIVGGTIATPRQDKIYNTCFVFDDKGNEVISYDKTHLFELHAFNTEYSEKEVFEPGNHFVTFNTPWAKIGILVCYDIRFPEVSRLLALEGCKILCCPAAFNYNTGLLHWKVLNTVRALENEVYFCGVGPAHYDYNGFSPYGHSMIVDPFGKEVIAMEEEVGYRVVDIDLEKVNYTRQKMPLWKVRRNDLYKVEKIK